ncbi:MAG: WGR domain-containing protein [Gammaproteobacteria bacterium]|nr:WGR domain-containing protein [Gammaproteobacteria bacterium]
MRIYLQTPLLREGQPRFYHLRLQPDLLGGWNLLRISGVEGCRGSVQSHHFPQREDAELKMMEYRDRQLAKGYRVMFIEGEGLVEREV